MTLFDPFIAKHMKIGVFVLLPNDGNLPFNCEFDECLGSMKLPDG